MNHRIHSCVRCSTCEIGTFQVHKCWQTDRKGECTILRSKKRRPSSSPQTASNHDSTRSTSKTSLLIIINQRTTKPHPGRYCGCMFNRTHSPLCIVLLLEEEERDEAAYGFRSRFRCSPPVRQCSTTRSQQQS